jgi:hypothetical protein
MKMLLLLLFGVAAGALRAEEPGSSPTSALLIQTGGSGLVSRLVRDTDVHWYRFLAAPALVYTVRVDNVSLWDHALSLHIFAEGAEGASTNSAIRAPPGSALVWTNTGGLRHYYVAVSAFLEFTTGTYVVAVDAQDADADGDGLPDAWETLFFGGATNAVATETNAAGETNWRSFVTGANPRDPAGALRVTPVRAGFAGATISWPAVPYASYRIESSTGGLMGSGWSYRERRVTGPAADRQCYLDAAPASPARFYRIVYEMD